MLGGCVLTPDIWNFRHLNHLCRYQLHLGRMCVRVVLRVSVFAFPHLMRRSRREILGQRMCAERMEGQLVEREVVLWLHCQSVHAERLERLWGEEILFPSAGETPVWWCLCARPKQP